MGGVRSMLGSLCGPAGILHIAANLMIAQHARLFGPFARLTWSRAGVTDGTRAAACCKALSIEWYTKDKLGARGTSGHIVVQDALLKNKYF